MNQKKFAIVGCGAAARKYYLPVLKTFPKIASQVYCVDSNISVAKSFAEDLGSQYYFDVYKDIINEISAVVITVPPSLHYPIGMDFIKKNVHVLCEKPLAEIYRNAEEMVHVALENNIILCVNNTRRLFPNFEKTKEIVSNGTIGALKSIKYFEASKFAWESISNFYVNSKVTQKGVFLDLGSHVIDLICWWLGRKPELITFKDDSYGGPESLVRVNAISKDCNIEVILNRHLDIGNAFILEGEKGQIFGRLSEFKSLSLQMNNDKRRSIKINTPIKQYSDIVKIIIKNFINIVLEGEKPLIPGKAVLPSIQFIEECYANRSRLEMPWNKNLEELMNE